MICTRDEFPVSSLICKPCRILCPSRDGTFDSCKAKCWDYYVEHNFESTATTIIQEVVQTTQDVVNSESPSRVKIIVGAVFGATTLLTFLIIIIVCGIRKHWWRSVQANCRCCDIEQESATTDTPSRRPATMETELSEETTSPNADKWKQVSHIQHLTLSVESLDGQRAELVEESSPPNNQSNSDIDEPEETPLMNHSSSVNPTPDDRMASDSNNTEPTSPLDVPVTPYGLPPEDPEDVPVTPYGLPPEGPDDVPVTPFGLPPEDPTESNIFFNCFARTSYDLPCPPVASVSDRNPTYIHPVDDTNLRNSTAVNSPFQRNEQAGENGSSANTPSSATSEPLNLRSNVGQNSGNGIADLTNNGTNDLVANAANTGESDLDVHGSQVNNMENYLISSSSESSDSQDDSGNELYSDLYPSQRYPSFHPSQVTPSELGVVVYPSLPSHISNNQNQ